MTLLELTPTESVLYDPATGYGYLLTRAPARRGHRSYGAVMADLELIERAWQKDLTSFLETEADSVASRVRGSSRRIAKFLKPVEERGEAAGHKFHGNQWSGGGSWSPTMSRTDAEKWAADSAIKHDLYHGTGSAESTEKVLKSGFDVEREAHAGASPLGKGVYLAPNTSKARGYAEGGIATGKRTGDVLTVKVNVKKVATLADVAESMKGLTDTKGGELTKRLQERGFDAIHYEGLGEYVVFDPKNVVVVRDERAPTLEVRRDSLGDVLARLFDKQAFRRRFRARARGLYDAVVDVVIADTVASVGVSFDVKPSAAVKQLLDARANRLAGYVADSTYDQIKRVLRRGIEEGDAVPDLANRVRDVLTHASKHRATVIARTEVISAYNGGVHQTGQDLPKDVVIGQMWVATQDSRTRPAHRAADGQVVARDDTFTVGGEELRYPGDPAGRPGNIINCRCALRLITPLDDVTVPPKKRSPGPYVVTRDVEHLLSRVSLGRLTHADAVLELRGEAAGHRFHGNQWSHGGGTSDAVERFNAGGGGDTPDERMQTLMTSIVKERGLDGHPTVRPTAEVLAGGDEGLTYRSHSQPEYAEAFRTGAYRPGVGMYGMGYYAQSATMEGGRAAALEKAASYGFVKDGGITAQRFKPGTKMSTQTELETHTAEIRQQLGMNVDPDPGVIAAVRGVDAYTGRRDNVIIVNRASVVVGDVDPRQLPKE